MSDYHCPQPPAPSQAPVLPQGGAAGQPPDGVPAGRDAQAPACPETLHARQLPQLPEEQQTESVQKPLAHSVPSEHEAPGGLRPQLPQRETASSF